MNKTESDSQLTLSFDAPIQEQPLSAKRNLVSFESAKVAQLNSQSKAREEEIISRIITAAKRFAW